MQDPANLVYQGKEGTGAAFLLDGNKAADVFNAGVVNAANQRRLDIYREQQRKAKEEEEFNKAFQAIKTGDYWSKDTNEIVDAHKALQDRALQLKVQNINPFIDPGFKNDVNKTLAMAKFSRESGETYGKVLADYVKNPERYENGEDLLKWWTRPLSERMSGDFNPPKPIIRHTLADAIEQSNGHVAYEKNNDGQYNITKVDRNGILDQGIGSLDTEAAKYLIRKRGGDPSVFEKGFPVEGKDGRPVWSTDPQELYHVIAEALEDRPGFVDFLKSKKYDTSDPAKTVDAALDFAQKQNKAIDSYLNEYADAIGGKRTTEKSRVYSAEVNRRANEQLALSKDRNNLDHQKYADAQRAASPDEVQTNVITNIATTQTKGGGVVQRPSTSLAAANVGTSKASFIPQKVYNPNTGLFDTNSSPIAISGGQVHIKPILKYKGMEKILDDESLKLLKAGRYKLNGKAIPANAQIEYDELLYGEEYIPADPQNKDSKSTTRKLIIPVTGQPLDGKFEKGYDRDKVWEAAIKAAHGFEDKKELIKQQLKRAAPNISDAELDRMAFETAKQY